MSKGFWTKRLSRRTFLGGAGATIALPYLEAMVPAGTRSAYALDGVPKRALYYYVPNGIHMPDWTPAATGTGFELTPTLASLAPHREDLLLLSGLANNPANPDGPGDHAAGTGSFLTATHVYKTEGSDISNAISVDQVMANALGSATTLPSLQVGAEGGGSVGGCDSGYSCAYSRNISWAGPSTPLPKISRPQLLFDRLFAGGDPSETAEQEEARRRYRGSVLDYALDEANSLHSSLGVSDQAKLDEYMTGVRELETRIESSDDERECGAPDIPVGGIDAEQTITLLTDLMVLAFQCDLTRFTTFMLGNAGSNRQFPFLGISEGHHGISHHQGVVENHAQLSTINEWEVRQFAYLLERMKAVEEPDGTTLLENSMVFFSSEIEDGNSHSHSNLPVLMAGQCQGTIETGRHVRYSDNEPIGDLFVSQLDKIGVEVDEFGDDGTGPLEGI
ncbi:MAG: hypothetical protein ACJAYU_001032 [Bradymonadia bacterium]|jgi:hypothetical protein